MLYWTGYYNKCSISTQKRGTYLIMKQKISLLLACIFIVLVFCGCETQLVENPTAAPPTEPPTEAEIILTLDDLGGSEVRGAVRLTNMGLVNGEPNFVKGGLLIDHYNSHIKLLDLNGNPTAQKDYDKIDQILSDGICIVSNQDAFGISAYGIVDSTSGEELIACEAIEMKVLSDRFIQLSYINEITTEKEYYGSFYRGDYLLYYTGYGKIYDLQERQFVPNLELTSSKYRVTTLQSVILVETSEYSVKDVYHANGTFLGSYVNLIASGHSGIALQVASNGIYVYNGNMEKLNFLPGSIYEYDTIPGSDNMLVHTESTDEGNQVYLIDLTGKKLSQGHRAISAVYGGKYICHSILTEEGTMLYGISSFQGNDIIPPEYLSIQYIEPGYFLGALPGGYRIIRTDGSFCNEEPLYHHGGSPVLYQDDYQKLFILETGELYETQQRPAYQCLSLMLAGDKLIDVISGEIVMENVDDCMCVSNNLYIWDKSTQCYTRYLVEYIAE